MITIETFFETLDQDSELKSIEDIFFEATSKKEFTSPEHKASFFKRWCGDYLHFYPEQFLLMKEEGKLLGYLSGCQNSREALLKLNVPGHAVYQDLFDNFPAHLHINFHHSCRGRGLGSDLINAYCEKLLRQSVKGLHLITSPEAKNVSFYHRLGFLHQVQREYNGMQTLFMGKLLEHDGQLMP